MKKINKIIKCLKKQEKIEKKLQKIDTNVFIGKTVVLTKQYKLWLQSHLNELFDTDSTGNNLHKKDKIEFNSRKILIKKKVKGKIIEAKKDSPDYIVFKIEFKFPQLKNHKSQILLSVKDIKVKA
jgi:hypothetical protein